MTYCTMYTEFMWEMIVGALLTIFIVLLIALPVLPIIFYRPTKLSD